MTMQAVNFGGGSVAMGLALLLAAGAVAQGGPAPAKVTATLQGRVLGADGERVRVTLLHDDMRRIAIRPLGEGFSDEDGKFTFREVPWFQQQEWGSNSVTIVARVGELVGVLTVRGDQAPIDELEVELKPGIDIRGRLFDEDSGEPIADGWVWPSILGDKGDQHHSPEVWWTSPMLPWRAVTNAKGEFVLRGVLREPCASRKRPSC